MKNKTSLTLMEQVVMVMVFALAAAICLQAFALSSRVSRECEARDEAVLLAQNTVELLKYHAGSPEKALAAAAQSLGGSFENGTLLLAAEEHDLLLLAQAEACDIPGLSRVRVQVLQGDEECFFLIAAWQEVS